MIGLGRGYTAKMSEAALTSATDLLKIVAPSNKILIIDAVTITTKATAGENVTITVQRATGGATSPAALVTEDDPGDPAFSGNAYDLSGAANSTPSDLKHVENVDVRSGFYYEPKQPLIVPGAGILVINWGGVTTAVDIDCYLDFREVG